MQMTVQTSVQFYNITALAFFASVWASQTVDVCIAVSVIQRLPAPACNAGLQKNMWNIEIQETT